MLLKFYITLGEHKQCALGLFFKRTMVKPLGVVVMEVKWEHSILVGRRISLLALLGHDDNKKWAIFQLVLLIVFKLY